MDVERQIIQTTSDLLEACGRWRQQQAIGVDTEFVRERTFYPGLGLIQISDGAMNYLVDTVALTNLEPLHRVFQDPAVTKIFHSCGEDLEVLYHRFGEFPQQVFDTQVAAALAGLGGSLGYGPLVAMLFDVELPKDKTRTNWLRRPLSEAQEAYAALDVVYLIPAYLRLSDRLRRSNRESWAREELEPLFEAKRFLPDPEQVYLRIRAWKSLAPRQVAALRGLAAWRERQARKRNLPRNFVIKEKALVDLARRRPKTIQALTEIHSLHPRERERYGGTLIRLVRQAGQLSLDELPEAARRPVDLTPYKKQVQRLRTKVAEIAEAHSLPSEMLATRKTVESLMRRVIAGKTPALPDELRGWRRDLVGQELLETLKDIPGQSSS